MKRAMLAVLAVPDSGGEAQSKNPNEFDFTDGKVKTTITLNEDSILIRKTTVDEKKKTETPKGEPVTILRSALGSVKITRTFSPGAIWGGFVAALGAGGLVSVIFAILAGLVVAAIVFAAGIFLAFPKTMVIYRKDGTKYKTVVSGGEEEYERLIKLLFK